MVVSMLVEERERIRQSFNIDRSKLKTIACIKLRLKQKNKNQLATKLLTKLKLCVSPIKRDYSVKTKNRLSCVLRGVYALSRHFKRRLRLKLNKSPNSKTKQRKSKSRSTFCTHSLSRQDRCRIQLRLATRRFSYSKA